MKIVFLSHASLSDGFVVGSHQLAKALINMGHEVSHTSSPVSLLHPFLGKSRRKKFFYALKQRKQFHKKFGFIDYIPVALTPTGYHPWLDKVNSWLVNRQIRQHVGSAAADLVLIDQPLMHSSLCLFDGAMKVYRPTDQYVDMGGERFAEPERISLANVSSVVATSQAVGAHIEKSTDKPLMVLPNGVDFSMFDVEHDSQGATESCIYVGAIDFRFDMSGAVRLAAANPDIVFNYYGPVSIEMPAVIPENLVFHGAIPYDTIPDLLKIHRYSIIPMNDHPANQGRSPMKLYEFLAAGLPVFCPKSKSITTENRSQGMFLYDFDGDIESQFAEFKTLYQSFERNLAKSLAQTQSWSFKANQLLEFARKTA